MHTLPMHLLWIESSKRPVAGIEDAVADLVDRILRARYRDVAPKSNA